MPSSPSQAQNLNGLDIHFKVQSKARSKDWDILIIFSRKRELKMSIFNTKVKSWWFLRNRLYPFSHSRYISDLMYFKSHCPLHILLEVQMACLFHVTMKIYLPIQMHIHTYIYLHEYKYRFIPFIGTYLFSFLSALKCREAPSFLSTSAPEQILTAALQYFPRVSPPLGGSRESYHHLPLINRVGTLDIHLPE